MDTTLAFSNGLISEVNQFCVASTHESNGFMGI